MSYIEVLIYSVLDNECTIVLTIGDLRVEKQECYLCYDIYHCIYNGTNKYVHKTYINTKDNYQVCSHCMYTNYHKRHDFVDVFIPTNPECLDFEEYD